MATSFLRHTLPCLQNGCLRGLTTLASRDGRHFVSQTTRNLKPLLRSVTSVQSSSLPALFSASSTAPRLQRGIASLSKPIRASGSAVLRPVRCLGQPILRNKVTVRLRRVPGLKQVYEYYEPTWLQKYAPYIVGGCVVVGGVVWLTNREPVPFSGRRHFVVWGSGVEQRIGSMMFQNLLKQEASNVIPDDHQVSQAVREIAERLISANSLAKGNHWEFAVIRSDVPNAFVLPGGKVVVYSALLGIEKEDDMAFILSHEIGHFIARHHSEKLTKSLIYLIPVIAFYIYAGYSLEDVAQLLTLRNSRKMESEADYIGLHIMTNAGYDPRRAPRAMKQISDFSMASGGQSMPEILSTHPSDERRIRQLTKWVPNVLRLHVDSVSGQFQPVRPDDTRAHSVFRGKQVKEKKEKPGKPPLERVFSE